MGKTPKPLTIVALSPCDEWDELKQLEEAGHTIRRLDIEADLIIGSRAWYMTTKHRRYLTDAIQQARLRKYGELSFTKKEKSEKLSSIPDIESGGISSRISPESS